MKKPKILVYDIETSLMTVETYGVYDQFIDPESIVTDWNMLSFAAKWLGEKKVIQADLAKSRDKTNDKAIVTQLRQLLDEADIVITQNGKSFDQKRVYARLAHHGITPPSPSDHIDTKQIAKSKLGFTCNKLDYLAKILGVPGKLKHKKFPGKELWRECQKGNKVAWSEMRAYNIQDIHTLEGVYNKLKAWDTAIDRSSSPGNCRVCDGTSFIKKGIKRNTSGKYQQFQCNSCGAWMKGADNMMPKEERKLGKRRL